MKNIERKNIILSSLVILTIIIMTLGVTYAVFSYTKIGSTVNTITTGTLKFIYTENTGVGNGIVLTDAEPVSDEVGKAYSTENYVFDFKIESNNVSNNDIPYEITLEKDNNSTLTDNALKVYLTDMTENTDSELLTPTLYSNLILSDNKSKDTVERVLYQDKVSSKEKYSKSFRLRIWVDENLDYKSGDYNGQTFLSTVNVYANQYITEDKTLKTKILSENDLITATPTLTTSSNNTSDASGLYKSTDTNTGLSTYYFRGNVENNYVDFAGFIWRIVRINEDGTIRIVMQDGINNNTSYTINSVRTSKDNMYYSNSDTAKPTLESWFSSKIASNENYSNRVVSGNYFCEEAKVAYNKPYASNSGADMKVYNNGYTSDFTCEKDGKDGNGKGFVNASVGLLTYDEVLHAGGYYGEINSSYYLYNNTSWWAMSPAGFSGSDAAIWRVTNTGRFYDITVGKASHFRAVLNLKADTTVTGTGKSTDPYVVIS